MSAFSPWSPSLEQSSTSLISLLLAFLAWVWDQSVVWFSLVIKWPTSKSCQNANFVAMRLAWVISPYSRSHSNCSLSWNKVNKGSSETTHLMLITYSLYNYKHWFTPHIRSFLSEIDLQIKFFPDFTLLFSFLWL